MAPLYTIFDRYGLGRKASSVWNFCNFSVISQEIPNRVLQSRNPDPKSGAIPLSRGLVLASHLAPVLSIPNLVHILPSYPESRASNKGNPGSRKPYWGSSLVAREMTTQHEACLVINPGKGRSKSGVRGRKKGTFPSQDVPLSP